MIDSDLNLNLRIFGGQNPTKWKILFNLLGYFEKNLKLPQFFRPFNKFISGSAPDTLSYYIYLIRKDNNSYASQLHVNYHKITLSDH